MKKNIIFAIIIALIVTIGVFAYQWRQAEEKLEKQNKENKSLTNQIEQSREEIEELKKEIEKLKNSKEPNGNENGNGNNEEPELETYKSELFIQAPWGEGKGEVGLHNPSAQGVADGGPNYGPQSFDVAENDHLFLLDSVNERVIEYNEKGKWLRSFPIACGGTGDIRISPDNEYLYIFSWRCGAVYKYNIGGKLLETYSMSKEILLSTLGTEGLEFDKEENIMLELRIDEISNRCKFYQIGEKGDEWKENSYFGYISKDGKEFYHIKTIDKKTVSVRVLDGNGSFKREALIRLPEEKGALFVGVDQKSNIYLEIVYTKTNDNIEKIEFEDRIRKYNKEGKLLSTFNLLELFNTTNGRILNPPLLTHYIHIFAYQRITSKGDVYHAYGSKDEGLKIFKYSMGETSISMGYIKKVYEKNGKRYLDIDYVQWLTGEEALKAGIEDGICEKDEKIVAGCFKNNFYIRNQNPKIRTFEISKNAEIIMCSYGSGEHSIKLDEYIDYKTFKDIFDKNISPDSHFTDYLIPFHITIQNDKIITIAEKYTP